MKEEDKIITIYSKNGITIRKKLDRTKREADYPFVIYSTSSIPSGIYKPTYSVYDKKIKIKCESPLGFYYTKEVVKHDVNNKYYDPKDLSKDIVYVYIKNLDSDYTYEISYLMSYHGLKVCKEIRPWDLLGGAFPDNFLFGLLNDINKIFDELEATKNATGYNNPEYVYNGYKLEKPINVREIRNKIMIDLFGDIRGPKFQTNNEKILAHGFDLKTSFRKM